MKISKKLLIIGLLSAFTVCSLSFVVTAQDTEISDQQIELIKSNCVSNKNTLTQLHSSDALLRVNRGQIYELMLTRLMQRFNSRVASNNLDATNLKSIKSKYETTLDTFRSDYIAYENQLTLTMDIDCQKQPVAFFDAVGQARTKRTQMHTDVISLNQLINDYKMALQQFSTDFQTKSLGDN